ncbi:MAG: hypothetical protein JKY54_01640 [Flavobacteriales bacterium]|nr:hypothetical protein [Flavobacteriales bacterium]
MLKTNIKGILLLLLFLTFQTERKAQKILGTGTNSDVVAALKPIQSALKKLLMQKSRDYKLYESMNESQKSLKAVYEVGEVLAQMKVAFEILDMIKAYSCIIKDLDMTISNPKIRIPYNIEQNIGNASCIFEYDYQQVLSGLTLCLDIVDIVVTDVQMSLEERLSLLHDIHDKMQALADKTIRLTHQLKYG